MCSSGLKYKRSVGPLFILAFLFVYYPLNCQNRVANDPALINDHSGNSITPGYVPIPQTLARPIQTDILIPPKILLTGTSPIFLDSLKFKAYKHLVTRKLYDFVIVSDKQSATKQLSVSSEITFSPFTGKKIRKIEIRRLEVFGSDIDNPFSSDPNKLENILNKTHLNTNEYIIKKNLLFSEGDTISPLILSDNERILRDLPFINDSRILVVPVSGDEVDIIVLTRDVFALGGTASFSSVEKGFLALFDKNVLGLGSEIRLEMIYNEDLPDSPGFGLKYNFNNIAKSFVDLNLFYFDGLGEETYGININRKFVSATTKYAGGISVRQMFTSEDLDTMTVPEPLKYNLQDYWLSRSFLLNSESVSRLIFGIRYMNNNVFSHPFILPDSFHNLQKYKMFLVSAAFSRQKFYKTNLIYSYGQTEDIPYGLLINVTAGKEINEFKERIYGGINLSTGHTIPGIGYSYLSAGLSTFFNGRHTEQGLLLLRTSYFSNLNYIGNYRIRNFVKIDYTRGFDRYSDEFLSIVKEHGFSGFSNDSTMGNQRLSINLETVVFSPLNFYGFRFAFFSYADLGFLFGTNQNVGEGDFVSSIGVGIRIRNNNLLFNTFQIRIGFFPNLPEHSRINYLRFSGEELLKPYNFESGPPSILLYK
ncbi:MAG: hypothetical protein GT600_01580 [Bacteroidales bacterium]|jgi:hypothetical protein|nr:hypothetical protein [Bacteroidales bacterium]NMD03061.1 hypothetical protein [Bacteroidales bacterium]HOU01370.1 hypothetical protein [Bacteroidales bacterium]HQK67453.1 hypothetical protein [Bacteroidales bacterium]